jgi:hypothetical protein
MMQAASLNKRRYLIERSVMLSIKLSNDIHGLNR